MVDNEERIAMIEKGKGIVDDLMSDKICQKAWIVIRLVAPECVLRIALHTGKGDLVKFQIHLQDPYGIQIRDEIERQIDSLKGDLEYTSITNEEFRSFVQGIYEDSKNQVLDGYQLRQRSD